MFSSVTKRCCRLCIRRSAPGAVHGRRYSSPISGLCIIGLGLRGTESSKRAGGESDPRDPYTYAAIRSERASVSYVTRRSNRLRDVLIRVARAGGDLSRDLIQQRRDKSRRRGTERRGSAGTAVQNRRVEDRLRGMTGLHGRTGACQCQPVNKTRDA